MKHGMKKTGLSFVALSLGLLVTGLIAGCSSGDDGPKGGTIDACALLKEVNPEALLGGPVDGGRESVHRNDAEATISMCSYSARGPGYKSVSLLVKYYPQHNNPKTASDFLEGQDFGNVGLKKPTEIHGLGDVALLIKDEGVVSLQVFWKRHYRMTVGFTEPDDPARALEKAKSVARHVMEKL